MFVITQNSKKKKKKKLSLENKSEVCNGGSTGIVTSDFVIIIEKEKKGNFKKRKVNTMLITTYALTFSIDPSFLHNNLQINYINKTVEYKGK